MDSVSATPPTESPVLLGRSSDAKQSGDAFLVEGESAASMGELEAASKEKSERVEVMMRKFSEACEKSIEPYDSCSDSYSESFYSASEAVSRQRSLVFSPASNLSIEVRNTFIDVVVEQPRSELMLKSVSDPLAARRSKPDIQAGPEEAVVRRSSVTFGRNAQVGMYKESDDSQCMGKSRSLPADHSVGDVIVECLAEDDADEEYMFYARSDCPDYERFDTGGADSGTCGFIPPAPAATLVEPGGVGNEFIQTTASLDHRREIRAAEEDVSRPRSATFSPASSLSIEVKNTFIDVIDEQSRLESECMFKSSSDPLAAKSIKQDAHNWSEAVTRRRTVRFESNVLMENSEDFESNQCMNKSRSLPADHAIADVILESAAEEYPDDEFMFDVKTSSINYESINYEMFNPGFLRSTECMFDRVTRTTTAATESESCCDSTGAVPAKLPFDDQFENKSKEVPVHTLVSPPSLFATVSPFGTATDNFNLPSVWIAQGRPAPSPVVHMPIKGIPKRAVSDDSVMRPKIAKRVVPLQKRQPEQSAGSATHASGDCKPCIWYWRPQGCERGDECLHCHFCPKGAVLVRKRSRRAATRLQGKSPINLAALV